MIPVVREHSYSSCFSKSPYIEPQFGIISTSVAIMFFFCKDFRNFITEERFRLLRRNVMSENLNIHRNKVFSPMFDSCEF